MAYLYTDINHNCIKPLNCWRSDEMIRYPHVQVVPFTQYHERAMINHSDYSLIPNQQVHHPRVPLHYSMFFPVIGVPSHPYIMMAIILLGSY